MCIAGVVIFLVVLFYGASLNIPFAHHDAMRYFGKHFLPQDIVDPNDPYFEADWSLGRPLAAITGNFIFHRVEDFAGLAFVRAISVGMAALFGCGVAYILLRTTAFASTAVLLGVLAAVLPGFQDRVVMPMPYYVLGAWGALGAALFWNASIGMPWRMLWTAGCLIFAMLCYPVAAFLFVPLLSIHLFWPPAGKEPYPARHVMYGVGLLFFCSAVYLFLAKAVLLPRFPAALASTFHAYNLQPSLPGMASKLPYLFCEGAAYFLNPFSPYGGIGAAYLVLLVALVAMTLDQSLVRSKRFIRMLLWLFLLLASVFVWAVSPMRILLYRALYPGMLLNTITLAWATGSVLRGLGIRRRLAGLGVAGFLALLIICSQTRLQLNVWNYNSELMFLRASLAPASIHPVDRIHVIGPVADGYGFNGQPVIDDVNNMNSSAFAFELEFMVKMGLWGQVPNRPLWYCRATQPECVEQQPAGVLLLTSSRLGEAVTASPNMLTVDFNDLRRATQVFRGAGIREKY